MLKKKQDLLFFFLLVSLTLAFLFQTIESFFIGRLTLTYDEPEHFAYGELIFNLKSDRFDDSKMPVSVLNVLPAKAAEHVLGINLPNKWQEMILGKIATIFASFLLGILCLIWAGSIYGRWPGLIAFGLYAFEPNIIAHSQLVTTDIYAAATATLSIYTFWRFCSKPGLRSALLAGLALGLCQIAKYSGILLYPIFLILVIIRHGNWLRMQFVSKAYRTALLAIWAFVKYAVVFLLASILVINVGFLFNRTATPLGNYQFKSVIFQSFQKINPTFNQLPIPVPAPYLEGLDYVIYRERTGEGYGNIYLLGEIRKGSGFPGYFIIASLLKVPIPILMILGASVFLWLRSFNKDEFWKHDMFLIVPALVYAIYFNFFFNAQIGIRFYLVVFPISIIFAARIFRNWPHFRPRTWILSGAASLYLIVSVLSYFPNYLPYFNEIIGDRSHAYRYLADSNIDWGQNVTELVNFLWQHPDYKYEPAAPTSGTIVVSVNDLVGVVRDPSDLAWLRENFDPIGNFRYNYLIYQISESDVSRINQ